MRKRVTSLRGGGHRTDKKVTVQLNSPEFQPVEAEWQRIKTGNPRKRDPDWYSFFGGPKNVRELAIHLQMAGFYELIYRMWSESVHAGMVMEALGVKNGKTAMRPVRHPELLQSTTQHATSLALMLAERLVKVYDPARWPELQAHYTTNIRDRGEEFGKGPLIDFPWKD
jgi:hypothetical protein